MSTPDVTRAQIVVYLNAVVVAAVVLFKLDLSDAERGLIVAGLAGLVGLGAILADAILRRARVLLAIDRERRDLAAALERVERERPAEAGPVSRVAGRR